MSVETLAAPVGMTFGQLVSSMLRNVDEKIVTEIAEECCEYCGGLPGECSCIEEVVTTDSWRLWPRDVAVAIHRAVSRRRHQH